MKKKTQEQELTHISCIHCFANVSVHKHPGSFLPTVAYLSTRYAREILILALSKLNVNWSASMSSILPVATYVLGAVRSG